MLAARATYAQVNLPPPPPPPIGQPTDLPPPPPPQSTQPPPPQPPRPAPPSPQAAPLPPYHAHVHRRPEVVYVIEEPEPLPVAITLNPLPLIWGRLSGNVEVQLAPHHSLALSPNLLVFNEDRGTPRALSNGFGFASPASNGVGIELGYHYWWRWARSLRGPFLGPSLLLGGTSNAEVGDAAHTQSYWGLAFDFGGQEVFPGGFTIGAGIGLGYIRMAGVDAFFPRALFQIGWSF
jgi:hypothetical protein